ncbi:GDSL esterase/lipase-like [Dorcoceras hygrometricum]|uniref:GDSL esterase/lipase-like n=1 Tax=Dorcoceras hygrometricum TaxID=472368 RepID=A0A2Z7AU60_9LAMI|nr:GDSL esterase/lipase-like [Dorcoceras hygrometricum]
MFGLYFRVGNHNWNNSGNFEIFEFWVKSGGRSHDVSSVCCRRVDDVSVAVERSFGESVRRFDDCWETVADPDPVSRRGIGRIKLGRETYLDGDLRLAPTGITRRQALHGIRLAVGPQPLWLRNHNSGLAQWIMVRASSKSPHDPLGITDSACKNQLVVVSVQYGPFNPYIPIRSTTIGKSRVAIDPIAMHSSWRSNSDIASVTSIGYPRMSASGESSTTMHRLLHASGTHPIPPPNDPNCSLSCCLFFVTTLRATAVSFLRLVFAPLQSSRLVVSFHCAATGCPDVDLEVLATGYTKLATAGCPVVGREMLVTGFPNDWLDQTMSYQLIQTTSFAMHPRLVD